MLKKGDKAICLHTTRSDGSVFKCFYIYETAALWDQYDGLGKEKPNVRRTYEPYDGVSIVSTYNGD
jgi:hypothetical protein